MSLLSACLIVHFAKVACVWFFKRKHEQSVANPPARRPAELPEGKVVEHVGDGDRRGFDKYERYKRDRMAFDGKRPPAQLVSPLTPPAEASAVFFHLNVEGEHDLQPGSSSQEHLQARMQGEREGMPTDQGEPSQMRFEGQPADHNVVRLHAQEVELDIVPGEVRDR